MPQTRRQARLATVACLAGSASFVVASAGVTLPAASAALKVGSAFMLAVAGVLMVGTRVSDTHGLWPAGTVPTAQPRADRNLRTTVGFYAFVLVLVALFFGALAFIGF